MEFLCRRAGFRLDFICLSGQVSAMSCLFASDYGPPTPGFDPLSGNGRLIAGFAAHRTQLAAAQNLGQLQAMERKFARGETVTWCDNGYGWAYDQKVGDFFGAIIAFVILPWLVMRVAPALGERMGLSAAARAKRGLP
jgi:hypothetical protein